MVHTFIPETKRKLVRAIDHIRDTRGVIREKQTEDLASLTNQQVQLGKQRALEFRSITQNQESNAAKFREEADRSNKKLNRIIQGQEDLLTEQETHKTTMESIKDSEIRNIQEKLEATTNTVLHTQQKAETLATARADRYAERAVIQGAPTSRHDRPTQNYLDMAKKTSTQIPAESETNGSLFRVYIRDWRKEPVGAVKRALRIALDEWAFQQ